VSPRTAHQRRLSSVLATAALVGSLLVGAASDVTAAPPAPSPPSAQDVKDAQGAVASASRSVASMEVRLAQLSAQTEAADLVVQQRGEAYTQALVDAEAAHQASLDAAKAAADADVAAETARRQLVAIAREAARSGGSTDLLQAVLSADGFQDVANRSATLERISGKTDEAVQKYRAAQLISGMLAKRAATAAEKAAAAKTAAADALSAAEQAKDDAERAQAAAAAERETLIDQLAAARQTSTEVERARQDFLDQQRRDRENAAAQAAALRPPPTATRPSGSTPPATTPPATAPPVTAPPVATPPGTTPPATTPPVTAPPVTTPPVAPPVTAPPPAKYGLGTGTSRSSAGSAAAALAWAQTKIGLPYVWAAAGPDSFDCSGLTMRAFQSVGVNLNRTTRDQYKQVLKVSYDSMRPGDLVFWTTDPTNPDAIYHVAIWAGGGQIMEASRPGVPLRMTSMRWGSTMPYAGRP